MNVNDLKMKKQLLILVFAFAVVFMSNAQTFSNVSSSLPDSYNSGNCVGFTDMDNDGFDDIVVLDGSTTVKVLYQDGSGNFSEVNYGNVSNNNQWGMAIGDYDNDGHKDVFSGGSYDGVHVKHIEDIGQWSDFDLDNGSMFMQGCNFADIDNDGQLDVFGCHDDGLSRIWKGNGSALDYDQELIDLTNYDYSDYPSTDHSGNYGSVFCDFDHDGDLDLTIAKCRQFVSDPNDPRRINQIWMNNGDGTWSEVAEERGLVLNEQSWTVDYADYDNDGDFDCYLTNHSTTMKLLQNDGSGYFTDVTDEAGLGVSGFVLQAKMTDFDNDGFVDVLISGGFHSYFHNNGDGTFTEQNVFVGADTMHSFAVGDVNRDGFADLYASYGNGYNSPDNNNDDILWLNQGNDNHWIAFDLEGIESNKDAVGATVVITGDFGTQIREVRAGESYGITNTFACMFGLGENNNVETVTISWPSGTQTEIENPSIDQYHNLLEAPCFTDLILTVSGETSICPGETVDLIVEGDFASYAWSNGSTDATLSIGESGNYTVIAYDAEGCAAISTVVSVEVLNPIIPEIVISGALTFCSGGSVSLAAGNAGSYLWSNGSVDPEILVTEPGTYFLTVTDFCDNLSLSETIIVNELSNPEPPIISGSMNPEFPDFIFFESSSETTHWFDSETAVEALAVGSSYELDSQISNTIWAENVSSGDIEQAIGGRTEAGEGQYHDNSIRWLLFDAYEDIVIHSVDVFANEAGPREIGVVDYNGDVVVSGAFDLEEGMNTIVLDFEVEEGSDYGLRSLDDDPQLWRDAPETDLNYPYAIGDLASITQSTAGGNNAYNYYYFFYNWDVRLPVISCSSERVEIAFLSDGCTDSLACNYDPNVAEDDGSCTYPGCLDSTASNYAADAGCEGDCFYLSYDCASIGNESWGNEDMGLFPELQQATHGVFWAGEWVFNVPAVVLEPQSGIYYPVDHVEWIGIDGLPEWVEDGDFGLDELDASSQYCLSTSGTPVTAAMHEINATGHVYISVFDQEFSVGLQVFSAWLEVLENPNPIPGCMYPLASNYLPYATSDNGSCVFFGCTDPDAADFNPFANIDDGSCGDGCDPTDDDGCSTDANNDGAVNVTDLLMLLGEFGLECE